MKVWEMKQYAERNANLKLLGFVSYGEYLGSTLWKRIRLKVLIRNKFKCHSCNKQAMQVHHKSYKIEVLQGKAQNELVPICGGCHVQIEFTNNGKKVGPSMANKRLAKLKKMPKKKKTTVKPKQPKTPKIAIHKPDPKNATNLQIHKVCGVCKVRYVSKRSTLTSCTKCVAKVRL